MSDQTEPVKSSDLKQSSEDNNKVIEKSESVNSTGSMGSKSLSRSASEDPKVESFSLADARKQIKKKKKIFSKDKAAAKELSLKAFQLPTDGNINEEQIDELIIAMIDPKEGIQLGKKKSGLLETQDNCFTGEQATKWILQNLNSENEEEAIQKGQTVFMNRGVFYSITKKHISFHNKSDVLYRFRILDTPDNNDALLNMAKKYILEFDHNAAQLSTELAEMIVDLLKSHSSENGAIDWKAIEASEQYKRYVLRTSALQKVSLEGLNEIERRVFFLNVHNMLAMHCYIRYGPPQSVIARKALLTKAYNIEGKDFSLETLFSIVRGIEVKEDYPSVPGNPVVHVLAFNGSDASPPMRAYSVDTFAQKSKQYAKDYLEQHIGYKSETDEVWFPKLFKEYGKDFGDSEKDVLRFIGKYVPERENYIKTYVDNIHIKYKDNTYSSVQFLDKKEK